jgi:hypothetical protein
MYKLLLGASLLLLIAGCNNKDGDDLIVLQNGSHQTGTLQGCLNGGCQFSGRAIPQATIAWIGLHRARSKPPQPNDPAIGEIRLIDHSAHPGLMTAINSNRVIAAPGSYDRGKVAWVYLTAGNETPTTSSKSSDGCRHATYHYDVHVAGYRRAVETMNPGFWITGTLSKTYDWTAEWSNVSLGVEQCKPTLKILMPAVDGPDQHPAIGEMHLKYDYDDAKRDANANPRDILTDVYRGRPPCHIFKDVRFAANMWLMSGGLFGKSALDGLPYMSLDFAMRPHSMPDLASSQDCPPGSNGERRDIMGVVTGGDDSKGKDSNAAKREQGTLKPVHGLDWDIGDGDLGLTKQDLPYPPLPFPIDALVAGKGFSLDSEEQIITIPEPPGATVQITDRMVVTFSPVGRYRAPKLDNRPPSRWHTLIRSVEDALSRLFE